MAFRLLVSPFLRISFRIPISISFSIPFHCIPFSNAIASNWMHNLQFGTKMRARDQHRINHISVLVWEKFHVHLRHAHIKKRYQMAERFLDSNALTLPALNTMSPVTLHMQSLWVGFSFRISIENCVRWMEILPFSSVLRGKRATSYISQLTKILVEHSAGWAVSIRPCQVLQQLGRYHFATKLQPSWVNFESSELRWLGSYWKSISVRVLSHTNQESICKITNERTVSSYQRRQQSVLFFSQCNAVECNRIPEQAVRYLPHTNHIKSHSTGYEWIAYIPKPIEMCDVTWNGCAKFDVLRFDETIMLHIHFVRYYFE